jgi:hypothetical protein
MQSHGLAVGPVEHVDQQFVEVFAAKLVVAGAGADLDAASTSIAAA